MVAYGPFNKNPNHFFLCKPIAVPEQIADRHQGLGFAMPISQYLKQKMEAGSIILKVNGQDPTSFVP